jgi:hypothetical protein
MTDWVKPLMLKWGEWVAGSSRRSSGGGSAYPAYQMVHIRGTGGGDPLIDLDAMEVDCIMAKIKLSKPELYRVGYELYVQAMSHKTVAGRMRCHLDTVYARQKTLLVLVGNQVTERNRLIVRTNG